MPEPTSAPAPSSSAASSACLARVAEAAAATAALHTPKAAANAPAPPPKRFAYGTAGFRTRAELLPNVMFRVGLLAAMRSASLSGATVGIMVTASHNPAEDNGVKIVEPNGDMLLESWEPLAEELANAASPDDVVNTLCKVAAQAGVQWSSIENMCSVVIARDTRPSGVALVAAASAAIRALSNKPPRDAGVLTTPQLHYVTRCMNDASYGAPSVDGYVSKFSNAFRALAAKTAGSEPPRFPKIVVDCANGVGAIAMARFVASLAGVLDIQLICENTNDASVLNLRCGADYVKTNNCVPDALLGSGMQQDTLYASLDGDADRVVCYLATPAFKLLDGDRIAVLLATALARDSGAIRPAVVQTAYANGASSAYIRDTLGLPLATTPTGVKHLHAKAHTFDLCVYFEPNGHGTVLYTKFASGPPAPPNSPIALWRNLTNETVGDGIADLLLVVAALARLGTSNCVSAIKCWCDMYTESPSRMGKVSVKARDALVVAKVPGDESRLAQPEQLQSKIDSLVAICAKSASGPARCFVRPSGTEDVVRVYAEAPNPDACNALLLDVSRAVYDLAGGIGSRP